MPDGADPCIFELPSPPWRGLCGDCCTADLRPGARPRTRYRTEPCGKALGADAARSAARSAGALPDPKLEFGFAGYPVSGPNAGHPERDDFSTVRVGIEQDVPNRAKRTARTGRADADIAASEAAKLGEARTVRLGAALAWVDLYFAARKLTAIDAVRDSVIPLIGTTPARLASASARPAQTIEPAQMLAGFDDRRAGLVADAAKARAVLMRWTGDTAPEVAGPPPTTGIDAVALRAGLDRLPEVRLADAAAGQADADARLAHAEKRPDWSWQVGYERRDPRFGDMLAAAIKIGLPLFAKNRQDPLIVARDPMRSAPGSTHRRPRGNSPRRSTPNSPIMRCTTNG